MRRNETSINETKTLIRNDAPNLDISDLLIEMRLSGPGLLPILKVSNFRLTWLRLSLILESAVNFERCERRHLTPKSGHG